MGSYSCTNGTKTKHFQSKELYEIDIYLDLQKNELKICLVGELTKDKELKSWGLPKGLGWVPHFNLYYKNTEIRIARIPMEWYGEQNNELQFE